MSVPTYGIPLEEMVEKTKKGLIIKKVYHRVNVAWNNAGHWADMGFSHYKHVFLAERYSTEDAQRFETEARVKGFKTFRVFNTVLIGWGPEDDFSYRNTARNMLRKKNAIFVEKIH